MARNQRERLRANFAGRNQPAQPARENNDSDNGDDERPVPDFSGEKMGAKKRAKLEAKAEKRAQREVELKMREEKKKKEAIAEEERKKQEEKEKEEERKQEELERLAKEEQERREYEEYLKLKESFQIEDEGCEEEENDSENQLQQFIDFIKNSKVVVLEDLASKFKLKTQAAIERITNLQSDGLLTGVIDDRGKFIYISEEELKSVAKFIKQRGRVSITELAESSNNLINLTPISVTE